MVIYVVPQHHPHLGLHQTQAPPAARDILTLIFKPKSHLKIEKVTSHAWLVTPGASGTESLLQTFLPFLWSHFQSFLQLHAGWNKYSCLTKAHKLTQNMQTNKNPTNQLTTKYQKKPWKTPNPTYWNVFFTNYPEQMMQCLCWPHASFILIEGEQKMLTQA